MELLSPAGTLDKLKTAILFGADAVYAGVPDFSLRSRINDFDYEKLAEGVEFAHSRGKKVYATLNIYAKNEQLEKVKEAAKKYQNAKVDAIILSDPGILEIVKEAAPKMPIHLSTQANCANWKAAEFWYQQGVSRIILAREVSLEEIREIHKRVPQVELECFVHGAMCMAYSGRCILSKLLSERSANQGWCSQPCRWAYNITPSRESEKSGEVQKNLQIEQDQHGTYILNSKDLCLIEYLGKLQEAGVSSFKIEGRTKSIYYVAAATKLYRQAIDNNMQPPKDFSDELEKLMNRGYTTGFLFGEEKCEHNFRESHKKCQWQFVGEVVSSNNRFLDVKIHNGLFCGDEVEFLIPEGENIKLKIGSMRGKETGESIGEAHGGQDRVVEINAGENKIPTGSLLRKMQKQ